MKVSGNEEEGDNGNESPGLSSSHGGGRLENRALSPDAKARNIVLEVHSGGQFPTISVISDKRSPLRKAFNIEHSYAKEQSDESVQSIDVPEAVGRVEKDYDVEHIDLQDDLKESLERIGTPEVAVVVEIVPGPSSPRGRGRPRKNDFTPDTKHCLANKYEVAYVNAEEAKERVEWIGAPDTKVMVAKASDSSLPRGRGRPRKSTLTPDAKSPLAKNTGSTLPRRGRGRPKKTPETSDVTESLQKDPALPRRGRGRPPKSIEKKDSIKQQSIEKKDSMKQLSAYSTPRRGPGRPRKNFESHSGSTPLSRKGGSGHHRDFKRMNAIKIWAQALAKHRNGRSSKAAGVQDVQSSGKDPALPKRGRGRPPKSIKQTFAMKLLAKASGKLSRSRGRPRKVVVTPSASESPKKSPSSTPRKRGRPRKNLVPEKETEKDVAVIKTDIKLPAPDVHTVTLL